MIVNDIDHVSARVQEIFELQIQPKLPVSMAEEPVLLESFEQALQTLRQGVPNVQQQITELIIRRCTDPLPQQITNIHPRYGNEPQEPSHFVNLILEPLSDYMTGPGAVLKSSSRESWTLEVAEATTRRYHVLLAERLLNVKTLEEKANKYKAVGKPRGATTLSSWIAPLPNAFSNLNNNTGLSDADKVRLQCVLDVQCYKTEVKGFDRFFLMPVVFLRDILLTHLLFCSHLLQQILVDKIQHCAGYL